MSTTAEIGLKPSAKILSFSQLGLYHVLEAAVPHPSSRCLQYRRCNLVVPTGAMRRGWVCSSAGSGALSVVAKVAEKTSMQTEMQEIVVRVIIIFLIIKCAGTLMP